MDNENLNNVPEVDDSINKPEVNSNIENTSETSQTVMGENQTGNETNGTDATNNLQNNSDSSPVLNEPTIDNQGKKKNKKGLIIGIIIVVIIIILAAAFFIYTQLLNNPTKIIKSSINDFYSKFSNNLEEIEKNSMNYNIKDDSIKISGDLKLSGSLLKDIENDKIEFAGGLDYKNKKAEVYGNIIEDDKNLIDFSYYLKNDHSYIKSSTAFDNIYDNGEEKFADYFNLESVGEIPTLDEIDLIVRDTKEALINSLDEKQMTKGKDNIDINGTKVKVNSVTYQLNKESIKDLGVGISKDLSSNDKFIDVFAKILEEDKQSVKKDLAEMADDKYYDSITKKGSFIVYTTGLFNKYVGFEFVTEEGKLVYYNYDDNGYFSIDSDGQKFEITSKREKDVNNVKINFEDNGKKEEIGTLTIRKWDYKNIDFDYEFKIDGTNIKGTMQLDNNKVNDKKNEEKLKFNVNVSSAGETVGVELNLNCNVELGANIADVDTSKALPFESMTQNDALKMQTAMLNLQKSKLYKFISQFDSLDYQTDSTGYGGVNI